MPRTGRSPGRSPPPRGGRATSPGSGSPRQIVSRRSSGVEPPQVSGREVVAGRDRAPVERMLSSRTSGGSAASRGSGINKVKTCVCSASSQLHRERSRLIRVETVISQRMQRLYERDEAFDIFQQKMMGREEELRQRQMARDSEDGATDERLEELSRAIERGEARLDDLARREEEQHERQREYVRSQHRSQKRLDRAHATRQQLAADRVEVDQLRRQAEEEARRAQLADAKLEDVNQDLDERRSRLEQLEDDLQAMRESVRSRQDVLDPIRGDLQAKEAELNERALRLEALRADLEEREARLATASEELGDVRARKEEATRANDELEARLSALWDDLHSRQQMLEGVDASLRGREDRLIAAEQRLAAEASRPEADEGDPGDAWYSWPDLDPDQVELELAAAELTERAWRERSAALAQREAELRERLKPLPGKAGAASGSRGEQLSTIAQ